MDKNSGLGKGKYRSQVLLLVILIGFCVVAIIEILYGQAQLRVERERLALEEENIKAVQELKDEWNNLKGEPSVGSESVEAVGEEQSVSEQPEKTLVNTEDVPEVSAENTSPEPEDREYAMQIVFLGDSILDNDRGDTGVAELIGAACNAKVYNMAIGGTTAALKIGDTREYENWTSISLVGLVNAIVGNIDPGIFDGYEAGKVLQECDFTQTDYFVIEYGTNDFLDGRVPQSTYLSDGNQLALDSVYTYVGAMENAVTTLHSHFPDAKIFIFSPHYCEFFDGERFLGDSYNFNLGYGPMVEFFRCSEYVAGEHKEDNVMFYDTMKYSGIDAYTANEYLKDGIHLSEAGRRSYAEHAIERIMADFYPEE